MLPHPVAVRWTGRVLEYVCELGNSLLVRLLPSPSSIKSTPSRHLTLPPPPSSPNPRPSTPPSSAACGRASSLPLKHSRAFPAPFSPLEPSHAVKKRSTPLPSSSSNSAKPSAHPSIHFTTSLYTHQRTHSANPRASSCTTDAHRQAPVPASSSSPWTEQPSASRQRLSPL